jgi:hypothetical protein
MITQLFNMSHEIEQDLNSMMGDPLSNLPIDDPFNRLRHTLLHETMIKCHITNDIRRRFNLQLSDSFVDLEHAIETLFNDYIDKM